MVIIMGTVKLALDRLEAAKPALQRMVEASRAEAGCIAYAYAQDVLDPETIHVAEQWRDPAPRSPNTSPPRTWPNGAG